MCVCVCQAKSNNKKCVVIEEINLQQKCTLLESRIVRLAFTKLKFARKLPLVWRGLMQNLGIADVSFFPRTLHLESLKLYV